MLVALTYPRIMSYKNGLFFFQVLYSTGQVSLVASMHQYDGRKVYTLVDEPFALVVFLIVCHVDCNMR